LRAASSREWPVVAFACAVHPLVALLDRRCRQADSAAEQRREGGLHQLPAALAASRGTTATATTIVTSSGSAFRDAPQDVATLAQTAARRGHTLQRCEYRGTRPATATATQCGDCGAELNG